MLYQQTVDSLEGPAKRKFLVDAEDVLGLREMDRQATSKETDMETRGAR